MPAKDTPCLVTARVTGDLLRNHAVARKSAQRPAAKTNPPRLNLFCFFYWEIVAKTVLLLSNLTTTTSKAGQFRETLASRILVSDGAMGTALYAKGIFINRCFDELNLSLPAMIREVHQDYVKAGAEIIETNTFGANRKRLAAFGHGDKVRAINEAGVRLAREAAGDQAFVGGAVGPLGGWLEPLGATSNR